MSAVLPVHAIARPLHVGARLDAVDTAKAIGIVLVVLGHAPGTPAWAVAAIYSFHMPLFFFLSGCLLAPERADEPLLASFKRHARSLLVPYAFFFVVSLLFWWATRNMGDRAAEFAGLGLDDALLGFATGLSTDLFVNPPLWFFPALMSCAIVYVLLQRWLGAAGVLALALVTALLMLGVDEWPQRLPWGLDVAGIALVFYAAGHALRRHAPWCLTLMRGPGSAWLLLGVALVGLLWWQMAMTQWRVDLAELHFTQAWLYLPCAAAGIAMTLGLSRLCAPTAIARWLSENSLVIFPLHALSALVGIGLVKAFWPPMDDAGFSAAWCLPFTVWSLATLVPVAWLLTRHAPVLLGRPRDRRIGSLR